MKLLPALPILVPMAAAVLSVLFRADRRRLGAMAMVGGALHLGVAAWLLVEVMKQQVVVLWAGGWQPPFGICLVADYLAAAMVLITAIIHVSVIVYARGDLERAMVRGGFFPFLQILAGSVCGAFLTGDLFNLYVWFEVMLMSSFGLLVMGRDPGRLTATVKYVTINVVATVLFITAIGLIYGMTGTLNLADLHVRAGGMENRSLFLGAAMLLMVAFGIKAAVFPLFFWLPAAYPILPISVSAFFAGMLSKVGVYALIRVFTLVFTTDPAFTHHTLLVAALFTMLFGVIGAASQTDIRRILSFHIISQVGYMVLGLGLFTPLAIAGSIVYLMHHIVVKANLFLVAGLIRRAVGTSDLKYAGGLYRSHGFLSVCFLIPAFALAGFPPLSGFWAKFLIIQAGIESGQFFAAVMAALVGFLTVFSMIKIWTEMFWKPRVHTSRTHIAPRSLSPWMLAPVVALALITAGMGLFMEPFIQFAMISADQLLDPRAYIQAVLGGTR
jgi:multicomponent Na+:H+ antiporter subunit D